MSKTTSSLRSSCCGLLSSVCANSSSIPDVSFCLESMINVSMTGVDNITDGPILFAIFTIVNSEVKASWGSVVGGGGGICGECAWEYSMSVL